MDVIVIGAGLSGLIAANMLQASGARVVVLDKGRGVGGRMATRRTHLGVFDHGAQFFTAREERFRSLVEQWQTAGIVQRWTSGFALADGTFKDDGEARYRGVPTMTAIPKHLAKGLDVRINSKAIQVQIDGHGWGVLTESGAQFSGHVLALTAPVPQSLQLLSGSEVALPKPVQRELGKIQYAPCLALLAQLEGASQIPEPGGLWFHGEPISWMADNHRKGVSTKAAAAITIHAGPEFSQLNWEAPVEKVTATLLAAAEPWLGSAVCETQLHRWRYSAPVQVYPHRCLLVDEPAPLVFAGDAFCGPRIEGAALSGLGAGTALQNVLIKKREESKGKKTSKHS